MIPVPLYRDPIYDGPADPMIIRNVSNGKLYMFYTQRRANQQVFDVSYCYGTAVGVAESEDGNYWLYRGALDLEFEFGHNTFWAPEIVYDEETQLYHMYVSYIRGVHCHFRGKATIEHYTSKDLFYWDHCGKLEVDSGRIIDPAIAKTPEGIWRMWYKDEDQYAVTCYADSKDLYTWRYRGIAAGDCPQEGPNVFTFGGKHWLISDAWQKGLLVYSSDDMEHFIRQEGTLLLEPGTRPFDNVRGGHADVFVWKDRAYIVYFVHPFTGEMHPHTMIQMAELKIKDGKLVCDRNAEFDFDY